MKWIAIAIVAALSLSSGAFAQGFGDKVSPLLNGTAKSKLVYTFAGVHNIGTTATVVSCTSTVKDGGDSFLFGVEFFNNGASANDVEAGSGTASLSPGDTDNVATQLVTALPEANAATGTITIGAGRIFSESKKIICTAFLVDAANSPPDFITPLPLFAKGKQRGN